jgi:hypothetical protein
MQLRIRRIVLGAAVLAAVGVPIASHVLQAQQVIKCYFKDCLVFEDGSRLCTVKEVPCPNEA